MDSWARKKNPYQKQEKKASEEAAPNAVVWRAKKKSAQQVVDNPSKLANRVMVLGRATLYRKNK